MEYTLGIINDNTVVDGEMVTLIELVEGCPACGDKIQNVFSHVASDKVSPAGHLSCLERTRALFRQCVRTSGDTIIEKRHCSANQSQRETL